MTRRVGLTLGLLGLLTCWSSLYTISETEQVIITQFGEPVVQPHTDPDLHLVGVPVDLRALVVERPGCASRS